MGSLLGFHAIWVWALSALQTESIYLETEDIKISGGRYVLRIQDFPYIISVLVNGQPRCGGSLLNPYYVITACHCVVHFDPGDVYPREVAALRNMDDYRFVGGTTTLHFMKETAQVRDASAFLYHPKCKMVTLYLIDHNIGLAKVVEPFAITDFVKPINLFSFKASEYDDQVESLMENGEFAFCTLAGYRQRKMRLMGIRTYPYPWEKCIQDFDNRYEEYRNTTEILCALGEEGEGLNQWDTGAAWVCDGYMMGIFTIEIGRMPLLCQKASTGLEWLLQKQICSPETECRIPTRAPCGKYCRKITLGVAQPEPLYHQMALLSISVLVLG